MRFADIKIFKVDDLLLDEGNYRFKEARDQKSCVDKIYHSNPQYFKGLMSSIAEDDLGEPLLVYQEDGKNIVLDGNRRLAALKVLNRPDIFSPSDSISEYAATLTAKHGVNLSSVQAQVSSDKGLIFKTVYERHAAGQGKSRIPWSAYGAARFRYDQKIDDGNDWYAIALLLETEKKHPNWTSFIDSNAYSHEVFRRIFRAALDKGVISRNIFSDRNQRIKTSADKKVLNDAIEKVNTFLSAMMNKDFSLSRNGKYADKEAVDAYISKFKPSPDNLRSQPPARHGIKPPATQKPATTQPIPLGERNEYDSNNNTKKNYGIERSKEIEQKLTKLGLKKLLNLYNSLCVVSLISHPQLLYVGAWSFFETLSVLLGKPDTASFESHLGSLLNNMGYTRTEKKELKKPLEDISNTGNLTKHSGNYYANSALQLRIDFNTLEPFILKLLDGYTPSRKQA